MGLAETSVSARAAARYTSAVTRGLRESAIIALGIVALVLLIALLTYSPDDPGFSFTGNSAPVRNRIGVIGAWLADVLFFLLDRKSTRLNSSYMSISYAVFCLKKKKTQAKYIQN